MNDELLFHIAGVVRPARNGHVPGNDLESAIT